MVNLKPANQSSQKTPTVNRRGFSLQKLLWFILASVLVHGFGLLILARYQRSQLSVKPEIESKAIEFVTIPEESEAEPPPETKKRAENNSVAEQNLKAESAIEDQPASPNPTVPKEVPAPTPPSIPTPPEPKPAPIAQPQPPKPQPAPILPEPKPVTPPPIPKPAPIPPEPKPVTPPPIPKPEVSKPPVNNQPPVLSDSDATSDPITQSAPPQNQSPIATSLPANNEPIVEPETPPINDVIPENSENSASSLLGGDYKKTLANGGAQAFFSPEAISLNAVLDPSQINALKDFDYNGYLAGVRETLRPNWNPDRTKIQSTVLKVELNRSGQIMKLDIARSSGSELFDRANLETFRKSAPFDVLPSEFPLETFKFQFEFSIID